MSCSAPSTCAEWCWPGSATSRRLPSLLKDVRSLVIVGAPHAIIWTHADEVSQALLDFIGHPGQVGGRPIRPEKAAGNVRTLCR